MDFYLSSGYGIILILWGIAFEVVGTAAMYVIYKWMMRDQRRQVHAASEAAELQPAPLPARPAAAERRRAA